LEKFKRSSKFLLKKVFKSLFGYGIQVDELEDSFPIRLSLEAHSLLFRVVWVASRDFHLAHNPFFRVMGSWVVVEENGTGLPSRP